MITGEKVEAIIFGALRTLNAERAAEDQIKVSPTTPLFGVDAALDSLALVSLIADVESSLNAEYDLSINLADDRALSRPQSPYVSVKTLKEYVLELAAGK